MLNDRLANDVRRNGTQCSGTDDDQVLRLTYATAAGTRKRNGKLSYQLWYLQGKLHFAEPIFYVKFNEIAATKWHILKLKCVKFYLGYGFTQATLGGREA